MWRCEHSVVVKAPKTVVWALWTDVANWPKWDTDLSEAALHGELEVGTEGKMKVADDALVSFTIHELVPEERLVTRTKMFGAKLDFVHEMSEEEGGVRVTHRAELKGFLGWLWRWFVARKIKRTLPPALDNFAKLAAETPAPAPAEGEKPAAVAPKEEAADAPAAEEPAVEGNPEDNEVRKKDMQEQIEEAAKAEVPQPEKPESLVEQSVEETAARPAPEEEAAVEQPASETAATAEPAAEPEEKKEEAPAAEPEVSNDAPVAATPSAPAEEEKPAEAPKEEAAPAEPAEAPKEEAPAAPPAEEEKPAEAPAADAEEKKE